MNSNTEAPPAEAPRARALPLDGTKAARADKQSSIAFLLRLKGALLYVQKDFWYVIGDFKEPCILSEFGFQMENAGTDKEGTLIQPYRKLTRDASTEIGSFKSTAVFLGDSILEEEAVVSQSDRLARMLIIKRNLSVSERIWNLIQDTGALLDSEAKQQTLEMLRKDGSHCSITQIIDGRWLRNIPLPIWDMLRDQILRCT